jgi:hypothetical protein
LDGAPEFALKRIVEMGQKNGDPLQTTLLLA